MKLLGVSINGATQKWLVYKVDRGKSNENG